MNKNYILKDGKEYSIRAGIPEDSSEMIEYINTIAEESDNLTFGHGEFHTTIEEEQNFIQNVNKTENKLFIIAVIDGKIIGNLHFTAGNRPRIAHTGEFGVSVLKKYWGNGIALELIKYLIEWAKSGAVVTKINLRVKEDNNKAIKLYKRLGFKEEGVVTREFCINGEYFSSYHMGLEI
ncbi:GNAT family N-acetyltransferase [Clostridium grantii]|uniref:Protein N-acetyltransferase, RimJ/RimL family n=1 Tax=Clostridium grantii DSM 8605 TaxID=1121316 RepID=A0A1M5X674_9CLOT|nr:GNAT family N-acetyltransferase [Clostridium grantii]SHH94713.1 Protein N-acetyltransferase, RimJ/RimL family [Clostridium grantii DSM 8605]